MVARSGPGRDSLPGPHLPDLLPSLMQSSPGTTDPLARALRDLRISVTDRCNFRCRYCMPAGEFGPDYSFLPSSRILSFEEILRITRITTRLGVGKIRLTGGEPLVRKGLADLVAMIAAQDCVADLALTTNGVLLAHHAEALALAGLSRVSVSLDALEPETFQQMNGVGARPDRVIAGIRAARTFGLPVKVNCVVQRGINEGQLIPLARWAREEGLTLRFIEFMDVGETNAWSRRQVVTADEILETLGTEFDLLPLERNCPSETALRWKDRDSSLEIGIVASISKPFCRACTRLRISADGQLFTCLFASSGHDLKPLLRGGADDQTLLAAIQSLWSSRDDRYSETRGTLPSHRAEMSYLGG